MNRHKHVHLGERLEAIDRIREGAAGIDQVAREMGVSAGVVRDWQRHHAGDRMVSLAEIRHPQSPEESRLATRVQLLARLVADADRELRLLHEEFIRGVPASNELFEASNEAFDDGLEPTKKFG